MSFLGRVQLSGQGSAFWARVESLGATKCDIVACLPSSKIEINIFKASLLHKGIGGCGAVWFHICGVMPFHVFEFLFATCGNYEKQRFREKAVSTRRTRDISRLALYHITCTMSLRIRILVGYRGIIRDPEGLVGVAAEC